MRAVSVSAAESGRSVAVAAPRRCTTQARRVLVAHAAADPTPGLLKKPDLKRPESPPRKLFDEAQQPAAAATAAAPPAPAPAAPAAPSDPATTGEVTVEWQRMRAKEMRKYFQEQQLAAAVQKSQVFGWLPQNEIGNGRWVMFGVFVGLLTEYATGVDFPDQLKLLLSYLGIVDLE